VALPSDGLSFSRTPVASHEVIAPRYRTNLMFEFCGNTNSNISTAPIEFEVAGNGVYLPGSVSPYLGFEGTTGPHAALGDSLGLGLEFTNAAGYANLTKLYNAYRVYGSRIVMVVRPSDAGEVPSTNARLIVVPFTAFSAAVFRSTPEQALTQPFGKSTLVSVANTNRYNMITHTMATHTIYGTSLQSVRDEDEFAAIAGLSPPNNWGWSIWYQQLDGLQATGDIA